MKVFWRVPVLLLLAAALSSVIYQVSAVDGSVGGSVLLPCIFTDSPSTKVFWRDKDDNVVLNIENGSPVYSSQNMRYRKRVTSIKEEIGKGNFSILMKNLQVNDSDTYVCTILPGVNERRVQLTVTEKVSPTSAGKTAGSSRGAAGPSIHQVVLLAAVGVLLSC
ncbi:T-cell surface glycoprotein CD4 [Oryzias melastigma]|uniref:T-cell surface glycoprotein CD4 n=1 Tax=Oryzias melastigma TaxID=30732 RepID=A0A834FNU0_ORYME|nr:CD276 antigen homolog [Oryzias melastigma]KAF6737190.1 T-cell surface glycoprotein CD4 [Oryzias melastigma]